MKTTIHLGADHAGFELKEKIKQALKKNGYDVADHSPSFKKDDDYPKIGFAVAKAVAKTKDSRGVLVCGSGVGVAIAANRVNGARAFDAYDEETTKLAREHNDANVITLSGWRLNEKKAMKLIDLFLKTAFSKTPRHRRRVELLK